MKIDLSEFNSVLDEFKEETLNIVEDNVKETCSYIHSVSKDNAPIDVGQLRENSGIYVEREDTSIKGYVGFMEFYALYVHQGTGKKALNGDGRQTPWHWFGTTEKWAGWHWTIGQSPKRFLYKAVFEHIPEIEDLLVGE